MTHDDVGVYCTMDATLFQKANSIFLDPNNQPEVFMDYKSRNVGSEEQPDMLHDPIGLQGCSHSDATVYVFTSVVPLSDLRDAAK